MSNLLDCVKIRAMTAADAAAAACLTDGRVIPVPNFEILFPDVGEKE